MKACTYLFPLIFLNIGQHNFLFIVNLNKSSDKKGFGYKNKEEDYF